MTKTNAEKYSQLKPYKSKTANCSCCNILIEDPSITDSCPSCKVAFNEYEMCKSGSIRYDDGITQCYRFLFIAKTNIRYED